MFTDPELRHLYLDGKSVNTLAKKFRSSHQTIRRHLEQMGVPIRGVHQHVGITVRARSIMDGVLLSDGCISQASRKGRSPAFRVGQSQVRLEWLESIALRLRREGFEVTIKPVKDSTALLGDRVIHRRNFYELATPHYQELQRERQRWYAPPTSETGKPRKVVPRDIRLTPEVVADWFCGDGTYNHRGRLEFCTNDFSSDDIDFLLERLLVDTGVSASRSSIPHGSGNKILVGVKTEAVKLATLMSPHIPDCCKYKLDYVSPPLKSGPKSRLSPSDIREIRTSSLTRQELASQFAVSTATIGLIQRRKTHQEI